MKYVLTLSLILNLLFGYLSYQFYSEKSVAQTTLSVCQEANASLDELIKNFQKEKVISERIISDYENGLKTISDKQCEAVTKIDRIPSNKLLVKKENINDKTQSDEVDIDGKLPSSLVSVLTDTYNSVQVQSH